MSPLETVRAFMTAMEKVDFDTALQYVTHDVQYVNGTADPVSGPEGIRATLEPFFTPLKENRFDILREAAAGKTVFVERLDNHLAEHGWFSLPVTGVIEVEDGKIKYWREYFDIAVIQRDLVKLMGAA